ncbi:MAG: histidine ammonia-lyase [Defluviitaleaceae bacterium]|nr:histidine ammonia-lyase [Defluviitaleaceae bacterium]MCL2240065.1 histidine ammonia-lyase [Defluviitaleaceae bacterium]MCL2240280.1 histidine ammonia-lyase [Defluviitaleaceae bacterium]
MLAITPDEVLTLPELMAVARNGEKVTLHPRTIAVIEKSRATVERMVREGHIVYGITTGFGSFYNKTIGPEETHALQRNLIESHACGVGKPLPVDVVRAMMLLRVKSLSQGYSGIRLSTLETLLAMLNKGVVPLVPEKGSLGASGDLCPLSHMILPMLGKGEAYYQGDLLAGQEAMSRAGIPLIELEAKEGLALNNGTQCMTAIGALAVHDALYLLETAELSAALSLEALNGRIDAFDAQIHETRRQDGQKISAARIRAHTAGSSFLYELGTDMKHSRVQDAYALRCVAQVHGASRDAINYVASVIHKEMNAVTDNPLIIGEEAISSGNFHGQPVALAMDFLGIALAELANIAERRLERMVNKDLSNGLTPYLTDEGKGGLHSGFMLVQYAAAALVSENKILAHPASVDSISSSNNQEDHVSMGTIAARKATEILENTRQVIAMELLTAAQAIDLRRRGVGRGGLDERERPKWQKGAALPTHLGAATQALYNKIRQRVPAMLEDRVIAPDIATVTQIIKLEEVL